MIALATVCALLSWRSSKAPHGRSGDRPWGLGVCLAAALLAGCGPIELLCRCELEVCSDSVCGEAVHVDGELHRIDPTGGWKTACGIDLDNETITPAGEAEDELRAGGGHAPCWRPRNVAT